MKLNTSWVGKFLVFFTGRTKAHVTRPGWQSPTPVLHRLRPSVCPFFQSATHFVTIDFDLCLFFTVFDFSFFLFLHAGSSNPRWCFKAGEGGPSGGGGGGGGGRHVTDKKFTGLSFSHSISQSIGLFGPAHPWNQGDFKLLRDRGLGAGPPPLSFRPPTLVHRLWRAERRGG